MTPMGVRYETGEQAKVLNRMFTEWMDQGFEQFQLPHGKKLKEMVGHTPIEVLTGAGAWHCAGLCHADGVKNEVHL